MPLVSLAADAGLAPPRATNFTERHRTLPSVEPGQLWLAEIEPGRGLSAAERHVLGSASVIIYDRSLADEVAAVLPLGGYAEPAPSAAELPDAAVIDRCVRFALDGWSVVRLIDAAEGRSIRAARLQAVSARLRAGGASTRLPVRVFADAGRQTYAESELGMLNAPSEGARRQRLIVVFGANAARKPTPACAVVAG
jgi:hypothetical protein